VPEFAQMISTSSKIEPLVRSSGGNILRISNRADSAVTLPPLQIVEAGGRAASNRIILRESRDSRLLRVSTVPLYSAFWALFITLLLLGMTWQRESR